MSTQLPCIVCGKVPEPVNEGTDYHPYGATEFETGGHYGSTVYDPMNGDEALILNVCDDCLRERHDRLRERVFARPARSSFDYKSWEPYIPPTN